MTDRRWGRRAVLQAGGLAVAGVLAGCGGDGGNDGAAAGTATNAGGTAEAARDGGPTETPTETDPAGAATQFQYGPRNTGRRPSDVGPSAPVETAWSFLHGPESPAVSGRRIYGSGSGGVAAFDARDGSERWTADMEANVSDPPALADGTLYVGGMVGSGNTPPDLFDGILAAVASADGTVRWEYEYSDTVAAPTVADGTVYAGSQNGTLYAVGVDGTEQWSFDAGTEIQSTPAVAGGTVYVRTGGDDTENVFALDAADGDLEWSASTGVGRYNSPVVVDGTVYAHGTHLYAFDAETGEEQWFSGGTNSWATPAVADGRVFVGGDGVYYFQARSAEDGTRLWQYETEGRVLAAPTVAGDTVYFGDEEGFVYALAAADGTERWTHDVGLQIQSAPVVADGRIYVSGNGESIAIESA